MKRIGIDIRELTGGATGIGNMLVSYLTAAQKQDLAKLDLELLLFGNQHTVLPEGINYEFIRLNECVKLYFDQVQLAKALSANRIDTFFTPYHKVPVFSKVRKLISIFDLTYLLIEPYKSQLRSAVYSNFLLKLYINNSDRVVTLSENSKNDIIRIFGLPPEKITVLYPCLSETLTPKTTEEVAKIKQKHAINGKYLLYVGNSRPHKNLPRLIKAYNILPVKIRQEYSLVMAGVGKNFIAPGCTLIPYIENSDLAALYTGAELFIFPSLYEGFGLPPIEAMACGCPVVSSNQSCMPEILKDASLYFDPYDINSISSVILSTLENPGVRAELSTKGPLRAARYNANNLIGDFIELLRA